MYWMWYTQIKTFPSLNLVLLQVFGSESSFGAAAVPSTQFPREVKKRWWWHFNWTKKCIWMWLTIASSTVNWKTFTDDVVDTYLIVGKNLISNQSVAGGALDGREAPGQKSHPGIWCVWGNKWKETTTQWNCKGQGLGIWQYDCSLCVISFSVLYDRRQDISWEYDCSLCHHHQSLLSRCGQRRLLLLEQEEPQVGKKKRRRIRQVSRYHKIYVQVSRLWWAAAQNPLPASSSTPSCKPSRACLPRSPSTGSRRLTPVPPLSLLPLLKLLPQPPPSWKGPTLPKSTTLHSQEVETRWYFFNLSLLFSLMQISMMTQGNSCNIGVIARNPAFLPYLRDQLTEEVVAEQFKHCFEVLIVYSWHRYALFDPSWLTPQRHRPWFTGMTFLESMPWTLFWRPL